METIIEKSALKLKEREIFRQNIWTASSICVAFAIYVLPIEQSVGQTLTTVVQTVFIAFALLCLFGSVYIYVSVYYSPRKQQTTEKRDIVVEKKSVKTNGESKKAFEYTPIPKTTVPEHISPNRDQFSPNIRNVDYASLKDTVDKTWKQIEKSQERPAPVTPQTRGHSIENITFQNYFPSPINEDNIPISMTDQLINKYKGGITRTVDALSSLELSDVKPIDIWIENLRKILGQHLITTMKRWEECIQVILNTLAKQNIPQESLLSIQRLLKLESSSERLPNMNIDINLEYILNQCQSMNITANKDYLDYYRLFFIRGQDMKVGNHHPSIVNRLKELYEITCMDPAHYLHIDYHRPLLLQQQQQQQQQQYTHISSFSSPSIGTTAAMASNGYSTIQPHLLPHDADLVISLFFHLCDSFYETHSKIFTHNFSSEHYVDHIQALPVPTLPGLSRGLDQVGILRTLTNDTNLSTTSDYTYKSPTPTTSRSPYSKVSSIYSPNGIYSNEERYQDIQRYDIATSPYTYHRKHENMPHFDVYIIHNYNEKLSKKKSYMTVTDRNQIKSLIPIKYMASQYEPWLEGTVGIELLKVIEGRLNCFECILILLIHMIKVKDPVIQDCNRATMIQKLILDIMDMSTWNDVLAFLHIHVD